MGMRMGRFAAVAAVAALGVAGCGGGDSGSDDQAAKDIKAVVLLARTSDDPQVECVDTVTENFVNTIYKNVEACKKAEAKSNDSDKPKDVKLTGLKVDGDTAKGDIELVGGDNNGAKGELGFAKEDGKWKVDSLSVEFLRSSLDTSLATADSGDKSNPLSDPEVSSCVKKQFSGLGDDEFTALAYDAIAQRDSDQFIKLITGCLSATKKDDGSGEKISALRKAFEDNVLNSAQTGATKAQLQCVVSELRKTISDDLILKSGTDAAAKQQINKAAQAAFIDCNQRK